MTLSEKCLAITKRKHTLNCQPNFVSTWSGRRIPRRTFQKIIDPIFWWIISISRALEVWGITSQDVMSEREGIFARQWHTRRETWWGRSSTALDGHQTTIVLCGSDIGRTISTTIGQFRHWPDYSGNDRTIPKIWSEKSAC